MRFFVSILLTALLAFISGLFLPWWGIAIASIIVALLVQQAAGWSFLSGFLGVFILWACLAFWLDANNGGVLSKKIAMVIPLGGNAILLILVTGLVGGLVAGFAAMSGSYLRAARN